MDLIDSWKDGLQNFQSKVSSLASKEQMGQVAARPEDVSRNSVYQLNPAHRSLGPAS